jgi:GLPGLI family protein
MLNSKTMKRIVILIGIIISVFAIQAVFGQETGGVILYENKVNMYRMIPKERLEAMKAMVPEFRTSKSQLFYSDTESIYKPVIEDSEEDMSTQGNGSNRSGIVMRFQQPNVEIYFNQSESMGVTSQEFLGKQYLITDSLEVSPWKFGEGTKTIAGYECKMAYYTDDSNPERVQEITAWYTDKLRPFLGPERYYTLPGAVLAIDINNGERVTVAQSIETRPLKKNELKVPTKGESITRYEFRKLVDERMKEMRQNGRQMMIRN